MLRSSISSSRSLGAQLGRTGARPSVTTRAVQSSRSTPPSTLRFSSTSSGSIPPPRAAINAARTAAALVVAGGFYIYLSDPLHNDAPPSKNRGDLATLTQQEKMRERSRRLGLYAWGSNRYNVVAPDAPLVTLIKTPRSIPFFDGMALRDVALEEKHGVAVDANGDVLQWGLGFFDATSREKQFGALDDVPLGRRVEKERANELTPRGSLGSIPFEPVRTLTGKNIVKVCATDTKVYALSKSGDIFVFSAMQEAQRARSGPGWSANPLTLFGTFDNAPIDFEKMTPVDAAKLKRGEKFSDLVSGNNHIIALTSQGRTFSAPTDSHGNDYGQLGSRKVLLNAPSAPGTVPKKIERTFEAQMILDLVTPQGGIPATMVPDWALPPSVPQGAQVGAHKPLRRPPTRKEADEAAAAGITEPSGSIRYCTTLQEIPALRSVRIAQITAGAEHSLARTAEGQVLGWGRHTHGQCGLGAQLAIDAITAPTEIVLAKAFPNSSVDIKCVDIRAGGDNSFFTMSRREPGAIGTGLKVDVLAVGKGQWGTLGNAMWSQVAATPARVKTVSGLMEYSESTGLTHPVPIHHLAIGKPGHVAVVLDTVEQEGHQAFGRDVMVWGHNAAYQLGTGRRSNLSVPQHLPPLPDLTPAPGAEAPLPAAEDPSKERLREADINSGVLTHMPHKRLQLASLTKSESLVAPDPKSGKRGKAKAVQVEEHITAGSVAMAIFWKAQA